MPTFKCFHGHCLNKNSIVAVIPQTDYRVTISVTSAHIYRGLLVYLTNGTTIFINEKDCGSLKLDARNDDNNLLVQVRKMFGLGTVQSNSLGLH